MVAAKLHTSGISSEYNNTPDATEIFTHNFEAKIQKNSINYSFEVSPDVQKFINFNIKGLTYSNYFYISVSTFGSTKLIIIAQSAIFLGA